MGNIVEPIKEAVIEDQKERAEKKEKIEQPEDPAKEYDDQKFAIHMANYAEKFAHEAKESKVLFMSQAETMIVATSIILAVEGVVFVSFLELLKDSYKEWSVILCFIVTILPILASLIFSTQVLWRRYYQSFLDTAEYNKHVLSRRDYYEKPGAYENDIAVYYSKSGESIAENNELRAKLFIGAQICLYIGVVLMIAFSVWAILALV